MLSHWCEKDHWLGQENQDGWGFTCKSEIWDGRRFSELQWFWNPEEEWQLPAKCDNCGGVVSVQDINSSPDGNDGQKLVTCLSCAVTFPHVIQKATGDPRNLAYILHWDGFQPFDGKYNHGSGAIEVQIANMSKEERQKQSEIFVVGFVHAYLLPEREGRYLWIHFCHLFLIKLKMDLSMASQLIIIALHCLTSLLGLQN